EAATLGDGQARQGQQASGNTGGDQGSFHHAIPRFVCYCPGGGRFSSRCNIVEMPEKSISHWSHPRCAPRSAGRFVEWADLGDIAAQRLYATRGRGVGTEKRRGLALGGGAHLLPQRNGGFGVVAGARGQLQADQVGLGFVGAAVGQG